MVTSHPHIKKQQSEALDTNIRRKKNVCENVGIYAVEELRANGNKETTKYNKLYSKWREAEGWEPRDLQDKDLSIKRLSSDQTGTHASNVSCRSYKPTHRTACMILSTAQPII